MKLEDIIFTERVRGVQDLPLKRGTQNELQVRFLPDASEVDRARSVVEQIAGQMNNVAAAGASILDNNGSDELTWVVALGACAQFEERRFPRRHSMCGVCFDLKSLQLFERPHRYFKWMSFAGLIFEEVLVCPVVSADGTVFGTIWVVSELGTKERFSFRDATLLELGAAQMCELLETWVVHQKSRSESAHNLKLIHDFALQRRRSDRNSPLASD